MEIFGEDVNEIPYKVLSFEAYKKKKVKLNGYKQMERVSGKSVRGTP